MMASTAVPELAFLPAVTCVTALLRQHIGPQLMWAVFKGYVSNAVAVEEMALQGQLFHQPECLSVAINLVC